VLALRRAGLTDEETEMGQERMFRLAVDALSVSARYHGGHGWEVVIQVRRGEEKWEDAEKRAYDHLSTPELADVLCSDVCRALGLE